MKTGKQYLKFRGAFSVWSRSAVVIAWLFVGGGLIFPTECAWGQAVQAWVQRYPGANAVALTVDGNGNVIVTGNTDLGSDDYVTMKYSAAGLALWTNTYNGPAGGLDMPVAVVVGSNGDIFVTGNSSLTSGASSSTEIATVAYSAAGVGLWTNRCEGSVSDAVADTNGNLFLGGNYSAGSGSDFLTIKFSGAGTLLWTNRYDSPANAADSISAMAVDDSGNVYVTGFSYAGDTMVNYDYATIAYSSAGVALWTNRYNGPYGPDLPSDIAVDHNGHVFVTGSSYNPTLNYSFATVAYSTAGAFSWVNRYPANSELQAQALTTDTNGNVFVTGYSSGVSNDDYVTIKYSGSGQPLWTNRFSNGLPSLQSKDQAIAIAADHEGNVVVTGFSSDTNMFRNYLTLKYSGSGAVQWTKRYQGPAIGNDEPATRKCLGIGPGDEVYVTGTSEGDIATVKYVAASVLPMWLGIEPAGSEVVLTWTNASFNLQSASPVTGLFTNIPGATSPYTNSISSEQRFFRLQSN